MKSTFSTANLDYMTPEQCKRDPFLGTSAYDMILQMELSTLADELEKWCLELYNEGFDEFVECWERQDFIQLVRECFVCPNRKRSLRSACKLSLAWQAELSEEIACNQSWDGAQHYFDEGY